MNRGQFRTRALQRADAEDHDRWDSTPGAGGELDPILSVAFDTEWQHALDAQPTLRVSSAVVTRDADGLIDLADLNVSGNGGRRYHRILRVSDSQYRPYTPSRLQHFAEAEQWGAQPFVYYRNGSSLMLLPKEASAQARVFFNHLPTAVEDLEDDNATIVAPGGSVDTMFNEVCVLEAAAMILAKGSAETGAAAELEARAEKLRARYLQTLARLSGDALMFEYSDTREEWAG